MICHNIHRHNNREALYYFTESHETCLVDVFQDVDATAHVDLVYVFQLVDVGPRVQLEPLAAVFRRLAGAVVEAAAVRKAVDGPGERLVVRVPSAPQAAAAQPRLQEVPLLADGPALVGVIILQVTAVEVIVITSRGSEM